MAERQINATLRFPPDVPRQDLAAVKEAMVSLGDAGVSSTADIAGGLQNVQTGTDKVFRSFADGKPLSDEALDGVYQQLGRAQTALETLKIPLDQLPESLKTAFQTANDQVSAAKMRIDQTRSAAEEARASIQAIGSAATAIDPLKDAFDRANSAEARLEEAIASGSPRMAAPLGRLVATIFTLNAAMREHPDLVTPEQQARLAQLQASLDQGTAKVRMLTLAMREHKTEVQAGGEQWTGLGDAVRKAAGEYGQAVAGILVGFAALREGYRIGQQLADITGVDKEAVKSYGEDAKASGKLVYNAFDSMVASATLYFSTLIEGEKNTGDLHRANESLLSDFGSLITSLGQSHRAADGYNLAALAGATAQANLTATERQHIEILDLHEKFMRAGEQGQKDFNKAIKDNADDIAAAIVQLNGYPEASKGFAKAVKDATDKVDALEQADAKVIKTEESHLKQLVVEKEKIDEFVKTVGTQADALKRVYDLDKTLVDAAMKYTEAENGSTEAIASQADKILGLTGKYKENIPLIDTAVKSLEAQRTSTKGLDDEVVDAIDTLGHNAKIVADLTNKNRDLKQSLQDNTTATVADRDAVARQIDANNVMIGTAQRRVAESADTLKYYNDESEAIDHQSENMTALDEAVYGVTGKMGDFQGKMLGVAHDTDTTGDILHNTFAPGFETAGTSADASRTKIESFGGGVRLVRQTATDSVGELSAMARDGIAPVGDAAATTSTSVGLFGGKVVELKTAAGDAKQPVDDLKDLVINLQKEMANTEGIDKQATHVGELKKVFDEAYSSGSKLKKVMAEINAGPGARRGSSGSYGTSTPDQGPGQVPAGTDGTTD